jgi:hypothetical protein
VSRCAGTEVEVLLSEYYRRLRRAVWLCGLEDPGLTPAPALLRRRRLLLHGRRAASPGATSLGGATRGAAMRGAGAAPPAQRRLRLACAQRRLRRDAFVATPHAATPHAALASRGDASRGDAPRA